MNYKNIAKTIALIVFFIGFKYWVLMPMEFTISNVLSIVATMMALQILIKYNNESW